PHVEVVVRARDAVRPEADGDAGTPRRHDGCDPGRELHIRLRVVREADVTFGKEAEVVRVAPDAVGRKDVRAQKADRFEPMRGRRPILLGELPLLVPGSGGGGTGGAVDSRAGYGAGREEAS